MKIKVVEVSSSQNKNKLFISIEKTQRVTFLLENNSIFEKKITEIRERHGITEDLWLNDNNDFVLKIIQIKIADKFRECMRECNLLTKKLKLPLRWEMSIYNFVVYNVFTTPRKKDIEVISLDANSLSVLYEPTPRYASNKHIYEHLKVQIENGATLINIPEKMSKAEFKKLIDLHWSEVNTGIFYRVPVVPQNDFLNLDLTKEIVFLRDEEKHSFREITEKLHEKHGHNEEMYSKLASEDYVKKLYYRWKNKIKEVNLIAFSYLDEELL